MSRRSPLKWFVHLFGNWYCRTLCHREFLAQQFVGINERPIEYAFVFKNLRAIYPKTVLDVGTGLTALPHLMRNCGFLVTAIDNITDYWSAGMVNRHYHVVNDSILAPQIVGPFDCITCVSVLEHIAQYDKAVQMMFSLLRPGGRLVLSFPYNEHQYVKNVYALAGSIGEHTYPFITQAFSRQEVQRWQAQNGGTVVRQEYWRFFSGEYWTLGDRIIPPQQVSQEEPHQLTCIVFEKRVSATVLSDSALQ